jgi:hypothetical protein
MTAHPLSYAVPLSLIEGQALEPGGGVLADDFGRFWKTFLMLPITFVPNDFDLVIEAARMDGAGEVRIVLTVIAPLIKTTLATVAMILFLGSWNDFLWPVIITNSTETRPLTVGLPSSAHRNRESISRSSRPARSWPFPRC